MFRRVLSALLIVAVGAVLLLAAWPQLVGIQREAGVVQLTTMRGLLAAIGVLVLILVLLAALLSTRFRQFAGGVAVLLFAFCAIQFAVLSTRGASDEPLPARQAGDVTVLTWNTAGDAVAIETLAQLLLDEQADIVVLPETSTEYAGRAQ